MSASGTQNIGVTAAAEAAARASFLTQMTFLANSLRLKPTSRCWGRRERPEIDATSKTLVDETKEKSEKPLFPQLPALLESEKNGRGWYGVVGGDG